MKKHINKSNKRIVIFAFLAVIFSCLSGLFAGNNVFTISFLAIGAIVIILYNTQDAYIFDKDKVTMTKIMDRKVLKWQNINKVLISDWYVKFKLTNNKVYTILKKNNEEDIFEKIKQDVVSKCDENKIEYHKSSNKEGIKCKGALKAIFIYKIIIIITYSILILVYGILSLSYLLKLNLNIQLIAFVLTFCAILVALILNAKVLKGFRRKSKKTIKVLKYFQLSILLTLVLIVISSYLLDGVMPMYMDILSNISSIAYAVFISIILIEYLNTSERVKHYFVK